MWLSPFQVFGIALAIAAILGVSKQAHAHPHVWVDVETTVAYDQGRIKGFQHRWTFDDMYTAMAIQGLDKNGDGKYDRQELAELAQVNIDGLKEFDYFTFPKLGETQLKIDAPQNYWLEHKNGILSLHFLLPIKEQVLANANGFSFQVYDPTYFIAFNLVKENPIRLGAGAPAACDVKVGVPQSDADEAQRLGEAFFSQFGGDIGITLAQTVSVECPKS